MHRFLNLRTPTPYPTGRPFRGGAVPALRARLRSHRPSGSLDFQFPGLQFDYEKKNRLLKGELIEFIDDVRPRWHFGFGPDGRGHSDEREGSDCRVRSDCRARSG
jgi:hypothetical protein